MNTNRTVSCKVNTFSIKGWKVIVLNSDEVPNNPILLKRPSDNKKVNINYESRKAGKLKAEVVL